MGDVVGVTDADGNLALEYFYDAWGDNFTAAVDKCDYDGKTGWDGAYRLYNDNPIKYRGYYFDHAIGMYDLQSRYFHTDINRFFNADDPDIARESKGIAVGMNLFAYCNNDPVNYTDPTGYIGKIDAAVCLVVFCVYFVAPYLLNDKKQKYNFEASKVYIDPTGLCIAKIKYYKSKLFKKSFQVVLGEKRDWGNKKNIENNMNMTAISYNSNQINSLMSKAGTSNFTKDDAIRVTISTLLNVCYLIKGGISTAKIKYNYSKIWGKYTGIYANSKVNVILARIIKGGGLNGWYHFF